jgi:hypothetical protein
MNFRHLNSVERPLLVAPLLAALFYIGLSVIRAWRVTDNIGAYTGCYDCFWLPTLGHDAWLGAILFGALAVLCGMRMRVPRIACGLIVGLILIVFASDLMVNSLLAQRLYLGDVLRLGKHAGANFSVVRAGLLSPAGIAHVGSIAAAIVLCITLCVTRRRNIMLFRVFAVSALLAGAFSAYAALRPVHYIHQQFTHNVVEVNLPKGRMQTFSPEFIREQRRKADALPKTCTTSPPFSGSVIIVLVESLSAWHSRLLGSAEDWTPQLDAIARANHYIPRFYANGISTSTAELAIAGGRVPIAPAGRDFPEFGDDANAHGSLPDIAHRSGRMAAFFTSGDVSFFSLGDWLYGLGFDLVDGSDSDYYKNMKRWQFSAAEDAALFDRVLDWLDHRSDDTPFISILLTVSTHPPFIDPRTNKIDPENAFKYVDEQVARFYAGLAKRGFLDHGVLIVVGDHRTMTPLHADEFAEYGERAFARVPLIVAGAVDMPGIVDMPFQQTDILPSIAELVGLETCRTMFTGSFLRPNPQPPQYVIHARGDDRDRVDVYWGNHDIAGFRLNGDASTWITSPPPHADEVAAWIDTRRVPMRNKEIKRSPSSLLGSTAD